MNDTELKQIWLNKEKSPVNYWIYQRLKPFEKERLFQLIKDNLI